MRANFVTAVLQCNLHYNNRSECILHGYRCQNVFTGAAVDFGESQMKVDFGRERLLPSRVFLQ